MHYDLMIVGGGVVGMSLALALKETSLRIALIDEKSTYTPDARLFALSVSSIHLLENIGLWCDLKKFAEPIHAIHASYQGRFGALCLTREDLSLPTLGYVLPAYSIEIALQDALSALSHITQYPASLKQLRQTTHGVTATIEMSAEKALVLTAPYLIGADGTHSTVREQLNIKTHHIDYEQLAIVTRTTIKRSHHYIAYERLNAQGAIAMLPLSDRECATIWSTNRCDATTLLALSDKDFLAALQGAFGYRLGRLQAVGKRTAFPLMHLQAKTNYKDNVLLIGNAAHTLHPIFAQGLNIAFSEIAAIADSARDASIDLHAISKRIQSNINLNLRLSCWLPTWLAKRESTLKHLSSLGMLGLNNLPYIKTMLLSSLLCRTKHVSRLMLSTTT